MDLMVDAYMDVMKRDVVRLCEIIPHNDLVIQWDINWETVALEHGDHLPDAAPMQFKPNGDPMDRFLHYVRELNAPIPKAVVVGMHLCYGDLHHKHFKDPVDLATSVSMANRAQEVSPRPINHVQMAVPRHRSDDTYFAPLKNLRFGDGTVYAGLVHYTDGVEGSLKRLAAFKRHYSGPTGVATECGLGRRPGRPVAEKAARNSSRRRGRDLTIRRGRNSKSEELQGAGRPPPICVSYGDRRFLCELRQKVNFADTCSCLALNIVRGSPKLGFG